MEHRYTEDELLRGSRIRIFRSLGCIGDSLSSGEFEYESDKEKNFWDCYEHSWGKHIERMTGVPVTNFSRGGMTAIRMYQDADTKSGENADIDRLFDPDYTKQGYFIALGVNDIKGPDVLKSSYGGRVGNAEEDICLSNYKRNGESFVGWYAKIIQRLQAIQPEAKFFLVTMPKAETDHGEAAYADAIRGIADTLPNCYVIDLYRDAPVYDGDFRKKYFISGHMNALGYLLTARLILRCADRIIQENAADFKEVSYIGSGRCAYVPRRRTPLMGWASWNCFRTDISEEKIKRQADALVASGLAACGYTYLNMDDGFFGGRDAEGRLLFHPERFPNGIKPVADYAHSLGLHAGIYSEAGDNTCGYYYDNEGANGAGSGLFGHEEEDLQLFFEEYGFDFLKVDWCGGLRMGLDEKTQYTKIAKIVETWRKRLNKPLVYNICRWQFPGAWAAELADSWRTGADIAPDFASVLGQIDRLKPLRRYCSPGHVNDPDMMQIGNGLRFEEEKAHFVMWCMLSAPLMLGCDLTKLSEKTLSLLKNEELIAIDQDSACLQAFVADSVKDECGKLLGEVWIKDLGEKDSVEKAVAFLNRSEESLVMEIAPEKAGFSGTILRVRDLIGRAEACREAGLRAVVEPHGVAVYRVKAEASCPVTDPAGEAQKEREERLPVHITMDEAQELLEKGAVLVDVRTGKEYAWGI